MDKNEFARDLRIDPEQLDVEAVRQAETFFKWAERAIEARALIDRMELRLDVVKAQTELLIRRRPGKYGLEEGPRGGVTEGAIKSALNSHPEVLKAQEAYFAAKDDSAMLDKAVQAMEMKKRSLEALITLHGQQYFAGPSTPRNLGDVYLKHQQRGEARVNERLRTRKRSGVTIRLPGRKER